MSFEKFGIVNHTKESKAADFVTYLEQGKVMATRCKKCETMYFPPQVDCPKCLSNAMEWSQVKGRGKLLTYGVVNYGPLGFEDKAPYTLAVAEFEKGIKVFATLSKDIKEDEIAVGMVLEVVPARLPDDRFSYELQRAG
ncbi:MAG: Zn-ribbon domain-containing OB-fold protein [Deltaproteobacteria bacterium]|nr:MAG: Zn-ribbon domain-containing OB-fold protein [Deltaproteobacteria bacterium]